MKVLSLLFTIVLSVPVLQADDYLQYLNNLDNLPTDEYNQLYKDVSEKFKAETGLSLSDIENLSESEFEDYLQQLHV